MGVVSVEKEGIIYAALFSDGLVKIGCTRNENQRMQSLSYARKPYKMLLFITAVSHHYNLRQDEKSFHNLFENRRIDGEYFMFYLEDWLEWFVQWESLEWAIKNGLLSSIAQYYEKPSENSQSKFIGKN